MMNLNRGSSVNMKWQHANKSQILERKHTTTTMAATKDEAEALEQQTMKTEIPEQQFTARATATAMDVAEVLEQKHATTTAAIRRIQRNKSDRKHQDKKKVSSQHTF